MQNKTYDIIIIGGGVVGCSIARELSKYNLKVALLEKEVELAFGVSKSNSGIIHPGTQTKAGSLKGRLCVEGNILIRKIAKELGIDFQEVGELIVAFSKDDIAKLEEIKIEAEKLGVKKMSIVDQSWLKENEPNLSKDVVGALFIPSAGIISPYRMTYDLSENAAKNGVEIFTDNEVKGIVVKKANDLEIMTTQRVLKTRYVINAAGLFADDISGMVGLDDFKITPRKGQEFLLDKKRENVVNHIIFPLPTKTSKGVLVIKTSDGNPMVGPTAQDVDDKEDLSTTDDGFKEVLSAVKQMIPSINDSDIIAYFSGLRPVAGEDFIIRHEASVPGFINVSGIQSPGLTAAPAIAKMVCSILQENGLTLIRKKDFKRYRNETTHLFKISKDKARKLIKENEGYGDIVCRCEMVSRKEIEEAIERGATTLDGVKFRTRAQAGRCHGGFCTTRILKILSEKLNVPITEITKRGKGSLIVKGKRAR
ncbi:MAG: NAD(P)/FAD-dependent oxidoreductase [Candidatus Omnitrophica bacterium]|nr:NAD(P)/FAD-dependent oxidoreductase [Candidatus Omnitrophota bacterium]MBU4334279.1 NAD(P)/FAD-dependent oxidoreductase [Candidatus Omnitrophota bacterium]